MVAAGKRKYDAVEIDDTGHAGTVLKAKRLKGDNCLQQRDSEHACSSEVILVRRLGSEQAVMTGDTAASSVRPDISLATTSALNSRSDSRAIPEDGKRDRKRCNGEIDDDGDFLRHLDSARQREVKIWRDQNPGTNRDSRGWFESEIERSETTAALWLSYWKMCLSKLQTASNMEQQPARQQQSSTSNNANEATSNINTGDDLLLHLHIERKRELNRLAQRRWSARHKKEQHLNDASNGELTSQNDTEDDRVLQLNIERRREQNRLRQRRWRSRRKQNTQFCSGAVVGSDANTVGGVDEKSVRDANPTHVTEDLDFVNSPQRRRQLCQKQRLYRTSRSEKMKGDEAGLGQDTFRNELSDHERRECMRGLQTALGAEGLEEGVCSVCDRVVLCVDLVRKLDTDWRYMDIMKNCLDIEHDEFHHDLRNYYRAPPHLPLLETLMVSPRGIRCFVDETSTPRASFSICKECDSAIRENKMPKFAIANGFFIGRLPSVLRKLTLPERFLTQLVSIAAVTRVMRGGRHRCIRSHCIAFDCTPGPPVLLLPRSLEDVDAYRVVMVGDFTPSQAEKVRKLHRIRRANVQNVIDFYKSKNHLYTNVVRNESVLTAGYPDDGVEKAFVDRVEDRSGDFEAAMDREQANVRGETEAWRVLEEADESTVLERRIGLSEDEKPIMAREHTVTGNGEKQKERVFEVRRSNQLANDVSGDLFGRMFPHLFPFGRGHPGEKRKVPVSVHECVKYYLMLSGRQFAEDELFALVAFDRISMRSMYIQNYYRCQRFPRVLDGYDTLSSEQLGRALLDNERRRQGCLPWQPSSDSVAQRFLKSVEIGARCVWGSNAERAQYRHKAFAYQTRYGQPALFVTLTPNTDNSLVLAHYAGVSSVETLFDVLDAHLPSKSELREASLKNDSASARLFMRHVEAFIRYVLGIDPETKKQLHHRGLFGDVRAYFGMVESQGRGTLHIHFLIWLSDCPPNSTSIERILDGPESEDFRNRVAEFANRIVTNDLPIPVENCGCSTCGAGFSKLTALPIPDKARKDPQAGLHSARARAAVTEPAMIQCSICKAEFSSQHFLRTALLKFRPTCWPPWQRSLTVAEIDELAIKEAVCRDSKRQGEKLIDERETNYASFSGSDMAIARGLQTAELLGQANALQMSYCKSDNDPFQNDYMTRLFEVSPPSSFDTRLSKAAQDYMVASLAVRLNQHMWSHTASCFKQSHVTANDSYCRYRYPREQIECTSFEPSGVESRRKLGHEFINGFNYEIMATFRCNHDIQILLGGKDICDRIHYCCKYVTKQQKRVDSQVAVAVAAFKRRQERETLHASESSNLSPDHVAIARRRVSAMVYNMTNRQEMAGPLASLYIFRGSCCYSSKRCVPLPLSAVVRQLTTIGDYSCTLVNNSDNLEVPAFQAVSFLDDYIFRPNALQTVNIYEFTMWYFRKYQEGATRSKLGFLEGHPLHSTHALGKRHADVVPVIHGFRIPFIGDQSSDDKLCKRAVLSLVLFQPFRCLSDLIGNAEVSDQEAWLAAFQTWEGNRSRFVETIMNNMDDFNNGAEKARATREQNEMKGCTPNVVGAVHEIRKDDASNDENDDLFYGEDCDFDENEAGIEDSCDEEDLLHLWDPEADTNVVIESSDLDPAACPTSSRPDVKIAPMLQVFIKHDILRNAVEQTAKSVGTMQVPVDSLPSIDHMKRWVQDDETDNALLLSDLPEVTVRNTHVVELLDNSLLESNMEWSSSASPSFRRAPQLSKRFATISDTSKEFTLNERQYYAFKLIGRALLSRWRQAENMDRYFDDPTPALRQGQLLLFLGGEGGTGKSRIIDAVQAMCESWGRSNSVMKTALTGKAATIIKGRTLASFLLQIKKKTASDAIMNLDLLIVDEISMMKKFQLSQLDGRLRAAKRIPGVPFGGAHVVLVGDFLQLPPVGGHPLYADPTVRVRMSADELTGFHLWREFTNVIMLKENVRFRKDPEWGLGCQQARLGVWTPEFVRIVNSRVLTSDASVMNEEMSTFVTPDNKTRMSINNLFITTVAKGLPRDEYPVRVVANFKGKLSALNRSEIRDIMALPDTKFGRMAAYLDLIVGMPIQITQNIRAEKMIANGTLGRLEAIVFHPDTTFRLVHDTVADVVVKIPSVPPPCVLVRVDRGRTATCLQGCNDGDIFPLFYDAQAYSPCEIRLAGSIRGVPRSLKVRIQQFPIVCAVSSTVYKVQGETLDGMVVTEWRSTGALANKREQPYLLVSRVTSRDAFATLTPLTDDITRWAHPSQDALNEEARLERLSAETIRRLRTQ